MDGFFSTGSKQLMALVNGLSRDDQLERHLLKTVTHQGKETAVKTATRRFFRAHPRQFSSDSEMSVGSNEISDWCFTRTRSKSVSAKSSTLEGVASTVASHEVRARRAHSPEPIRSGGSGVSLARRPSGTITPLSDVTVVSRRRGKRNGERSHVTMMGVSNEENRQKLVVVLQRCLSSLEDIRIGLDVGVAPPDGVEDLERKRKRSYEFISRFSRNYLYPLEREMEELARYSRNVNTITPRIFQKLLHSHQLVLQGFHSYYTQVSNCLPHILVGKFQKLLDHACLLADLHRKCDDLKQDGRESLLEVMCVKCKTIHQRVGATLDGATTSVTDLHPKKRNLREPKKKKSLLDTRLSMYSIQVRGHNPYCKRAMAAFARERSKYDYVKSRYKTAGLKHRPPKILREPAEKPLERGLHLVRLHSRTKMALKASSSFTKDTPLPSPFNEDRMVTMVQTDNHKENGCCAHDPNNNSNNKKHKNGVHALPIETLIEELYEETCRQTGEGMTKAHFEKIVLKLLEVAPDTPHNFKKTKHNPAKIYASPKGDGTLDKNHTTTTTPSANSTPKNVMTPKNSNVPTNCATPRSYATPKECHTPQKPNTPKTPSTPSTYNAQELVRKLLSRKLDRRLHADEDCLVYRAQSIELLGMNHETPSRDQEQDEEEMGRKPKRKQSVTVSGAKNAQLICIKDEDAEDHEEKPVKETIKREVTFSAIPIPIACKPSPDSRPTSTDNKRKSSLRPGIIKINRIERKPLRPLTLIAKNEAIHIIQYKLAFNKYVKKNHMYRKTTKIQPWVVLERIADCLLNELLLQVAQEIEASHVLDSMYRSEFQ